MTTITGTRIGVALSAAILLAAVPLAQSPASDSQSSVQIDSDQVPMAASETSDTWFVELASRPSSDGTPLGQLKKEKDEFRAAAAAARLQYRERFTFDSLWNGLSVRIAPRDLQTLARLPGVTAVHPVVAVSRDEDQPGNDTDLFTAVTMTGVDVVRSSLGYTGAGVRVAVIDTGIDYVHPDLGGCFGPGCRVDKGFDFVGDAFNNGTNATPVPDSDPRDCNGHGTHVSGIIGANAAAPGGVTGVAPGVTFHAYRVFGCVGTTTADIMIAAMERALADGADVLNMSIGSALTWPQYPTAVAASRLVNKGISVIASAGNEGTLGLYATSAPGLGAKVISVASYDNVGVRLPYFTVTPDGVHVGYSAAAGAPLPPTSGSSPMARTGTATSTADACAPLPAGTLTGRVALIRRGTCSFYQKAINAQTAGALGVVLYNNVTGFLNITVEGTPAVTIPTVAITSAAGVTINNRLAAGPVTMTWTNQLESFSNPTGGLISSFSSYGTGADLELKPDIGAPGGSVFSTLPLAQGGYGSLSGTSMASPHVAGAVALLLQAQPHTSSNAVRAILQNSAEPHLWSGNPGLGFLDNVHRQGAGMLRIDRAILGTTSIEPAKLSLGESTDGPAVRTLTISNNGGADVTYDFSHQPGLATGANTFTVGNFASFASVAFSPMSLTVPSGGQAAVNVMITAPETLADHGLYGGYLEATPRGGGQVARVPYSGFKGDYQSIQVVTPTLFNFPWLAKLVGAGLFNQPGGASYTLQGDDIPFLLFHLDHQSRRLEMTVEDTQGKSWHRVSRDEFLPRNSSPTSFFAFTWDGTTFAGKKIYKVPNGQYTITVTVLKALGDEDNPADVETWTSPLITIARP